MDWQTCRDLVFALSDIDIETLGEQVTITLHLNGTTAMRSCAVSVSRPSVSRPIEPERSAPHG